MPSVQFIPVKNNQDKLKAICRTVGQHFFKGDRLLVKVPTLEAADFIDQLLWKMPPESFIPHVKSEAATNERIVITLGTNNVNQATVLVNLSTEIHPELQRFDMVYELYDTTKPQLSQQRMDAYKSAGISPAYGS